MKYPEDESRLINPTMTNTPLAPHHAELALVARACGIDNPNIEHEFVRAGHLKNNDHPLTHSPNVLESFFPKAMSACGTVDVVSTKPLKGGEGSVAEGRIDQYHRCPDPSNRVRGRGHSLANNGTPLYSYSSASKSFPQVDMKVAIPSVVQTKPLKEGDGLVVKGRIAQHHQRPDPSLQQS